MKTLIALALLSLTGCAETVPYGDIGHDLVGFWHGLWHGSILAIAFIISLFDDSVAIYAVYNTGGWYDLGFLLGSGLLTDAVRNIKK